MGTGALIVGVALSTALGPSFSAQDTPESRAAANSAFNPAIGVVVDTRAVLKDREKEHEEFSLSEIELSFAADVDPFLKAEAYIAIENHEGETEVEAEEVFAQYTNLGNSLSGKFGKIAGALGRVNRNHTDSLQYQDYPLVLEQFFGEHGLRAPGASFSYLFPSERFIDLTVEALVPEDGPIFMNSRTSNPVALAHLRTFFDFNPDLSGQLGFTFANGPTMEERANVFGLDYTMKFQPGRADQFWQFEAEAYWADSIAPGADDTMGFFLSGTKALSNRLFLTGRYDFVEVPGSSDDIRGYTANITLKVSEFHFWRLEYQNIDSSFEPTNNRLSLQFVWGIGSHPAHKY